MLITSKGVKRVIAGHYSLVIVQQLEIKHARWSHICGVDLQMKIAIMLEIFSRRMQKDLSVVHSPYLSAGSTSIDIYS